MNKKKVIALVSVSVLLLGGVGTYFMLNQPQKQEVAQMDNGKTSKTKDNSELGNSNNSNNSDNSKKSKDTSKNSSQTGKSSKGEGSNASVKGASVADGSSTSTSQIVDPNSVASSMITNSTTPDLTDDQKEIAESLGLEEVKDNKYYRDEVKQKSVVYQNKARGEGDSQKIAGTVGNIVLKLPKYTGKASSAPELAEFYDIVNNQLDAGVAFSDVRGVLLAADSVEVSKVSSAKTQGTSYATDLIISADGKQMLYLTGYYDPATDKFSTKDYVVLRDGVISGNKYQIDNRQSIQQ